MSDRFVIISGCSGGGKSTLVDALRERGYATIAEPGRRIVREELEGTGLALPWRDPVAFAHRAIATATDDRRRAETLPGTVFFDRSLVDAAAALEAATGQPSLGSIAGDRYSPRVFLATPWPELFAADVERRHDMSAAVAEYERLARAYPSLGYEVVLLPKVPVAARVEFVLSRLPDPQSVTM